jgi:hypothetical protein
MLNVMVQKIERQSILQMLRPQASLADVKSSVFKMFDSSRHANANAAAESAASAEAGSSSAAAAAADNEEDGDDDEEDEDEDEEEAGKEDQ